MGIFQAMFMSIWILVLWWAKGLQDSWDPEHSIFLGKPVADPEFFGPKERKEKERICDEERFKAGLSIKYHKLPSNPIQNEQAIMSKSF